MASLALATMAIVVAAAELSFYAVVRYLVVPKLQRLEQPPDYPMDSEHLMMRCMETLDWLTCSGAACDFDAFVRGWFRGASVSEVREQNVFDFLSYAMFAQDYSLLPQESKEKVSNMRTMLEGRYNVTFAPGRNEELQCMRTSLEPVHYCHHPLLWYGLLGAIRSANAVWLRASGFTRHRSACGMVYWYREHARAGRAAHSGKASDRSGAGGCGSGGGGGSRRASYASAASSSCCGSADEASDAVLSNRGGGFRPDTLAAENIAGDFSIGADEEQSQGELLPLVFCHGIGFGLPIYTYMLKRACRGRTAVVLETPSISMTLHHFWRHKPPAPPEYVESVRGILRRHAIRGALFVGHSFGTVGVAWMLKHGPEMVAQVGLIDPVCLLLFLPDVARNFLYAHDQFDSMSLGRRFLKRLVAQEKGITHTLRRHFWWYHNNLWPEDLRCPAVVGVAAEDEVAPANAIQHYVAGWESHSPAHFLRKEEGDVKPVELVWWPGLFHGRSLFKRSCIDDFMAMINKQARQYRLTDIEAEPCMPSGPPTPAGKAVQEMHGPRSSEEEQASELQILVPA